MALNITPNSTDTLASSQAPIKNNFISINDTFKVDHLEYGTANGGMHNQIQFPPHINAIPSIAGNITLFNQTLAPTAIPDIWLKRGTAAEYPMTGFNTINAGINGWTYIPSGVRIMWGFVQSPGSADVTIVYNDTAQFGVSGFPAFTLMGTPIITRFTAGANIIAVNSYNATGFTAGRGGGSGSYEFSWIAIGI